MSDVEQAERNRRRVIGRLRSAAPSLLALLAFVLLVLLPGYVGSQPEFFRRYSATQPKYASWSTSTHAEVACASCHVSPKALKQASYRVRMLGEFYASIVMSERQPDVLGKPTNDACEQCHRDIRQASPSGDLKIPHRAHVEVLKLECVYCHEFVVHETNPEGTHAPRMATCLKCHDGTKAKRDCSACHKSKDVPTSHKSQGWLVEHAGRGQDPECAKCHAWTPDWCRDCHARRPASHSGKWRGSHKNRVAEHRNCEACHREDFCVRCHGELPRKNFDPGLEYVE